VIAVLLVLAGIAFMASVQGDLQTAAGTIADILVIVALIYAFGQMD